MTMLTIPAAHADEPARPDLAVTFVEDHVGGLVVDGGVVREQHFTTVVVQNVGSGPAGAFDMAAEVDPADHCHDSYPDRLVGQPGARSIPGLAPGASLELTLAWTIAPTPVEMQVNVVVWGLDAEETSISNNAGGAPMETIMPMTVRGDEEACDTVTDAFEDALGVVWSAIGNVD